MSITLPVLSSEGGFKEKATASLPFSFTVTDFRFSPGFSERLGTLAKKLGPALGDNDAALSSATASGSLNTNETADMGLWSAATTMGDEKVKGGAAGADFGVAAAEKGLGLLVAGGVAADTAGFATGMSKDGRLVMGSATFGKFTSSGGSSLLSFLLWRTFVRRSDFIFSDSRLPEGGSSSSDLQWRKTTIKKRSTLIG